jgi:hypothetical protein
VDGDDDVRDLGTVDGGEFRIAHLLRIGWLRHGGFSLVTGVIFIGGWLGARLFRRKPFECGDCRRF